MHLRLGLLAAASVAALSAPPAAAQCVAGAGALTCTGTQTGRVTVDDDGTRITVAPGAVVDGDAQDAFRLRGDDLTLTNEGTIQAAGPDGNREALKTSGDRLTVINEAAGLIRAADKGIQDDGAGTDFTLINRGRIEAGDDAVRVDTDRATMTNELGAVVDGGERALRSRGFGFTVENFGDLIAGDEAVEGRDGFMMTNHATGRIIAARNDGVQFGIGALINHGLIEGGDDAVDFDGGLVRNFGVMRAVPDLFDAAGIDIDEMAEDGSVPPTARIENTGTIEGFIGILADPLVQQRVEIVNAGVIEGRGGMAIELSPIGAGALLDLSGASELRGAVTLGGGDDLLALGDFSTAGALASGVIDGGAGVNRVAFAAGYGFGDLFDVALSGGLLSFGFTSPSGEVRTAELRNFQFVEVGGRTYAVQGGGLTAVPVPAGLALLPMGLVALWAGGRRRRGAASAA